MASGTISRPGGTGEGDGVADDEVISDERVAQVLGLYARMAHHVVADPER